MSAMRKALASLYEVHSMRHELDVLERDRIQAAKDAGAPWEKIAETLRLASRQAARQRHERLDSKIAKAEQAGESE